MAVAARKKGVPKEYNMASVLRCLRWLEDVVGGDGDEAEEEIVLVTHCCSADGYSATVPNSPRTRNRVVHHQPPRTQPLRWQGPAATNLNHQTQNRILYCKVQSPLTPAAMITRCSRH